MHFHSELMTSCRKEDFQAGIRNAMYSHSHTVKQSRSWHSIWKRIGHWPDYFTLCMWKLSGKIHYCICRGWSTHVLCECHLFGLLQRGRERSQRLMQMQRVQQKRNHLESIWWRPTKTHGLKIPGTVGTILKRMSFHLQERLLPSLWRNQPERRFCILQVRRRM